MHPAYMGNGANIQKVSPLERKVEFLPTFSPVKVTCWPAKEFKPASFFFLSNISKKSQ